MDEHTMPEETPRRGRPRRVEQEAERRRRRGDFVNRHLTVDTTLLDWENYDYRWIADRENRLFNLTKRDDWTVVTQDGSELKDDATDLGAAVSIVSGTRKDGSAERMYLCRKPRKWADEDRAKKEEARREVEDSIRRLASPKAPVRDGNFYSTGRTQIG